MGYKKRVKVRKWGRSKHFVEVPREWLDYWGVREGDELTQLGDAILTLAPNEELEEKARRLIEGDK